MKTCGFAKSLFALVLIGALTLGSAVLADEEGEPGIAPGSESADQVLEIPQQCDKDAVAVLCDRGDGSADSANQEPQPQDQNSAAGANYAGDSGQVVGSLDDYENQQETMDPMAVYYVPVPVYVPVYRMYRAMPAPGGVPSVASGPHFLRPLPYRHGAFGGGFGRTR